MTPRGCCSVGDVVTLAWLVVFATSAAVEGVVIASFAPDQAGGELLLLVVAGTWTFTAALFHGLPFVVHGLPVNVSGSGLVRLLGALGVRRNGLGRR